MATPTLRGQRALCSFPGVGTGGRNPPCQGQLQHPREVSLFLPAWVAPSVQRLTLDFGSGHDLTVRGIEPHVRLCADSEELAGDFLSPALCPYLVLSFSL